MKDTRPAVAVVAAVGALLSFLPLVHGVDDSSAFLGYVGSFVVQSSDQSYATVVTPVPCNQLCCCALCAADATCVGANYRVDSSQCRLLRLAKWELQPDAGSMLLVKGAALSNLEKRQYRTFVGALSDSLQMESKGNYTISMAQNATQCKYFCEMQSSYCYAYQFHGDKQFCKVFVGNYVGDSLPVNSTATAWSFSYHIRSADGPYRILPGSYPRPVNFTSYNESNIVDPIQCRQHCESQPSNCSLFAYNSAQLLCYIYSGDVPPNSLSFDFTAINWSSYYRFRDGSAVQECSTSYYFVGSTLARDAAEQYCTSTYGALLVKIDSSDELTFISKVINSAAGFVGKNVWIGAKSATYLYDFRWSCGGTSLSYTNWNTGEPNSQTEFCVHLRSDFKWNNLACSPSVFYFICESCPAAGC